MRAFSPSYILHLCIYSLYTFVIWSGALFRAFKVPCEEELVEVGVDQIGLSTSNMQYAACNFL